MRRLFSIAEPLFLHFIFTLQGILTMIIANSKKDDNFWLLIMLSGFVGVILMVMDWKNFTYGEMVASLFTKFVELVLPFWAMKFKTDPLTNSIFGAIIALTGCLWLVYDCIVQYSTLEINVLGIAMAMAMIIGGSHFIHTTISNVRKVGLKSWLKDQKGNYKTKKA